MTDDERQAHTKIDRLLTEAGWTLQDRREFNRHAGLGVAVGEFGHSHRDL